MIDELRKELKYYEKRRALHLANLAEEEQYHHDHPEEYFMPLAEVPFYRFWQVQLEICNDLITTFKQELRKFYE